MKKICGAKAEAGDEDSLFRKQYLSILAFELKSFCVLSSLIGMEILNDYGSV